LGNVDRAAAAESLELARGDSKRENGYEIVTEDVDQTMRPSETHPPEEVLGTPMPLQMIED
jgi:hypothetical protein